MTVESEDETASKIEKRAFAAAEERSKSKQYEPCHEQRAAAEGPAHSRCCTDKEDVLAAAYRTNVAAPSMTMHAAVVEAVDGTEVGHVEKE
ncbi:hypothetical protein MRX96_029439 [Rhipicephalus microplus]